MLSGARTSAKVSSERRGASARRPIRSGSQRARRYKRHGTYLKREGWAWPRLRPIRPGVEIPNDWVKIELVPEGNFPYVLFEVSPVTSPNSTSPGAEAIAVIGVDEAYLMVPAPEENVVSSFTGPPHKDQLHCDNRR